MRFAIHEYGVGIELNKFLGFGVDLNSLVNGIQTANHRIQVALNSSSNALWISDRKVKARGFAGVIQLNRQIELEIIPKFISSADNSEWKQTLYLLSIMSKYGVILSNNKIMSSMSYLGSLYEVAGRILADGYKKNCRKLIRKYRKETFRDFAIDGEIDFDSILDRDLDGIKQLRIRFDIYNPYNAVILKAMQIVLPYIKDKSTRNIILSAISTFGRQNSPYQKKYVVPARNNEWAETYNLAYDIVRGLANSFDVGKIMASGFIANTWKLWEWLLTTAMASGNKQNIIKGQEAIKWGTKDTVGSHLAINVFPDITVRRRNKDGIAYLLDAKYKNFIHGANGEVDRADLYEAFAFCNAAKTDILLLVYPEESMINDIAGTVRLKAKYNISRKTVLAVTVAFGSLNEVGGIYKFAHNLQNGVENIVMNL